MRERQKHLHLFFFQIHFCIHVIGIRYYYYFHIFFLAYFSYVLQNVKSTTKAAWTESEREREMNCRAYETTTRCRILLQHFSRLRRRVGGSSREFSFCQLLPLLLVFRQAFLSLCFDGHKGHES